LSEDAVQLKATRLALPFPGATVRFPGALGGVVSTVGGTDVVALAGLDLALSLPEESTAVTEYVYVVFEARPASR
jgi:hypothetical protein